MEIRRDRFCRMIFLCPFADVSAVEGLICMHICEISLANFIGRKKKKLQQTDLFWQAEVRVSQSSTFASLTLRWADALNYIKKER